MTWVDGKPEFRGADPEKLVLAVKKKLCWVCGRPLPKFNTFILGPMCTINRISAEPPSHYRCAQWSAMNCPFMTKPYAKRREDEEFAAKSGPEVGVMIRRNPGVVCLWTVLDYKGIRPGGGGLLFRVGEPVKWEWFSEGRAATLEEIEHSIETGLPALVELCEGKLSHLEKLNRDIAVAKKYLPKKLVEAPCQAN